MVKVATIAGSDASGGAGLEADLKTFCEFGLYGMAAVTVVAAMSSENWAHSVFPLDEKCFAAQLDTVFRGVGVSAAKSGMLGTERAVELSAQALKEAHIQNYVLDPVMVCKGADEALNPEVNDAVESLLLPICRVATPNLFEASQLAHIEVNCRRDMEKAAEILLKRGAKSVFIKGGAKLSDGGGLACDLFFDGGDFVWLESPLVATKWNHGAGCTTSAAVCAGLALGLSAEDACRTAKKFIQKSLESSFPLNKFVGPGNPSAWRGATVFR